MTWPKQLNYRREYYVPDLLPKSAKLIFVAESPHKKEIEGALSQRCPFRGPAGQQWWKMVCMVAQEAPVNIKKAALSQLCQRLKIAVVNSVQYPLGDIGNPVVNLGFNRRRLRTLWKQKDSNLLNAVQSLRCRLSNHSLIVPLGKTAAYFVSLALDGDAQCRQKEWIPHPSSWWNPWKHYALRVRAEKQLTCLFKDLEGKSVVS